LFGVNLSNTTAQVRLDPLLASSRCLPVLLIFVLAKTRKIYLFKRLPGLGANPGYFDFRLFSHQPLSYSGAPQINLYSRIMDKMSPILTFQAKNRTIFPFLAHYCVSYDKNRTIKSTPGFRASGSWLPATT
jgi:hypothetical protein